MRRGPSPSCEERKALVENGSDFCKRGFLCLLIPHHSWKVCLPCLDTGVFTDVNRALDFYEFTVAQCKQMRKQTITVWFDKFGVIQRQLLWQHQVTHNSLSK